MQPSTSTFGSFLVAALSASMVSGAALPKKGSFEIKRSSNAQFTGRNGPLALARAYAKYGAPVPKTLLEAVAKTQAAKRDSGSATATPDDNDLEYLVKVDIGTPAQTLNLDFDTGSSDLWVFSDETAEGSSGHNLYTASDSSSSEKMDGATWSISYGDGSNSSGDVYTDTVTVGPLTVEKQAVEAATKVSTQFQTGANDGLLGLAFSSINEVKPTPQKTWFDNISGSLDAPLFTVDFKHAEPGSYLFGAIPDEASNVLYTPADSSQGYWGFSTTTDFGDDSNSIADTGTTLLLSTDEIVDAYYATVDGAKNDSTQGGYVLDCNASAPDFSFTVGDGKITIPGDYIKYAPISDGSSTCFGGLQSSGGIGISIYGDVALKAAYVVFDAGNTQVGWSQKV